MINFNTLILFLLLNSFVIYAKLSDKRLCANEDCTELISLAKTLILYSSPEKGVLSFKPHQDVKVFSKEAGTRADLWGVEIDGRKGYVPHKLLREYKLLKKELKHLVSIENQENSNNLNPTSNTIPKQNIPDDDKSNISPDTVTLPYEYIDGTKIYLNDAVTPKNNEAPTVDQTTIPPNDPKFKIQQSEGLTPEKITIPTPLPKIPEVPLDKIISTPPPPIPPIENILKEKEIPKPPENTPEKTESQENIDKIKDISKAVDELTKKVKSDSSEDFIKNIFDDDSEDTNISDDEDDENNDDNEDEEEDENIPDLSESKTVEEKKEDIKEIPIKKEEENPIKKDEEIPVKKEEIPVKKDEENLVNKEEIPVKKDEEILVEKEEIPVKKDEEIPVKKEEIPVKKDEEIPVKKDEEIPVKKIEEIPIKTIVENPIKIDEENITIDNKNEEIPLKKDNEEIVKKIEEIPPLNAKIEQIDVQQILNSGPPPNVLNMLSGVHGNVNEVPLLNPTDVDDKKENLLPNVEQKVPTPDNIETTTPAPNLQFTTEQNILEIPPPIIEEITESSEDSTISPLDVEEEKTELPMVLTGMPEKMEEIETTTEEAQNENEGSGIFSKIYTNLFGSEENKKEELIEDSSKEDNKEEIKPIENLNNEFKNENFNNEFKNENVNNEFKNENVNNEIKNENFNEFKPVENDVFVENTESSNELNETEEINVENIKPVEAIEVNDMLKDAVEKHTHEKPFDKYLQNNQDVLKNEAFNEMQNCELTDNPSECLAHQENLSKSDITEDSNWSFELIENGYSLLLYMSLTAITVLLFVLGHYYIEKKRIDSTLISKINTLEKKLLVTSKENLLLHDELKTTKDRLLSIEDSSFGTDEMVSALKTELEEAKTMRMELEEKISNLERELENATEAGLESNRMLAEFLSSQHGIESIMENVESLQKQLFEQQTTINNMNVTLNTKTTENELLQTELSVSNDKIEQLQAELDKMVVNLLSVQEEKSKIESEFEDQTKILRDEYENKLQAMNNDILSIKEDNNKSKEKLTDLQSKLSLKTNEYNVLRESMKEVQSINSNKESLAALLDVSKVKAEVQQLREEKHNLTEKLRIEKETKTLAEKQVQVVMQEMQILKDKYEEADKEKVEAQTRLDVLSAYFKEKEAQLQKEISEHESLWVQKQGEATSTVERIKWIQEELQNYKSQNELLKKEILDQEVSMKSQISMLEKKAHDNWILARQAERKLEESKQEASQLRNRLTVVEKNLSNTSLVNQEADKSRILQPIESNGDIAVSPLHMGTGEPPGSPPLLFSHREHMTTSPPLPGMPPPFMPPPPPPGVPFMPPPPGVPPFMPHLPPALFPGDHRPPPLGRMSSPPIHGRYSPISYSPYDRDESPPLSPTYPDSDYRRGRSPPPPHNSRTFSPYSNKSRGREWEDVRDYRDRPPQQQQRMKPRSHKGTGLSSGSGNSNESLDNSGRHSGRV